jgi:hypothetical protein
MEEAIISAIVAEIVSGGVVGAGKRSWQAVANFVRARLTKSTAAATAIERASAHPDDENQVRLVTHYLTQALTQDPGFHQQLEEMIQELGLRADIDKSNSQNINLGSVGGHLVQVRDIHGGLQIGSTEKPNR